MSDYFVDGGFPNGDVLDTPTVNSYVVGVEVVPPTPPLPSQMAPLLSALEPAEVHIPAGVFTLTCIGGGFNSTAVVYSASTPWPTTFVNGTTITARIDATRVTTPRTRAVTVHTNNGTSNEQTLTFIDSSGGGGAAPTITQLVPGAATAGDTTPVTVSVRGTNFTQSTQIYIADSPVATTYISSTNVTTIVDPSSNSPGFVSLYVTTENGTSNTKTFTFRTVEVSELPA